MIKKTDMIKGLPDTGSLRTPDIADHATVFMLKGIHKQWKQPVCFTYSSGPLKSVILKNIIKDVIQACQRAGFKISRTVCDQGGANSAAINALLRERKEYCLRAGVEDKHFGFLINKEEVIPLFNVPHLLKGLRNNLLTKDLHFNYKGKKRIAKWEHIEKFYFLDSSEEVRICPKLTDQHIVRGKIIKMKVYCTQVFSHQVGSLMKRIAQWNIDNENRLPPDAINTAELILLMDELFDSLNSNNRLAPSGKPLKAGVKKY